MTHTASLHSPRVSVIMSVYNGDQYLREAIVSILAQTFADFEFIIIDDGSTDRSVEIVESFDDPRIRPILNSGNLGLATSLNKGLELARGDYIARMDCDDISLPARLERQVAFLDGHPGIGLCGTWLRYSGVNAGKVVRYPSEPELIRAGFLFNPVVAHPTVMYRRKLFDRHGLRYDPACQRSQDYELWARALANVAFSNLPEVLFLYRLHPAQVSSAFNAQQLETAGRVRRSLLNGLGLEPSAEDFETHQRLSIYLVNGERELFARADEWLCRLKEANDRAKVYQEPYFSLALTERLMTLLKKMLEQKVVPKGFMLRPRLFQVTGLGWGSVLKFFLQSRRGKVTISHA